MSLLSDWNGYRDELKAALKAAKDAGKKIPLQAVGLLKTDDLHEILEAADKAKAKNDADKMREIASKSQKFFMKYVTQFKAAKLAVKELGDELSDLNDFLSTYYMYLSRTQQAVALQGALMMDAASAAAASDAEKHEIKVKKILTSLRFKQDWKGGKKDFEASTGSKKPSEKLLAGFRKSSGIEDALDALDSACEKADPAKYREAYTKWLEAKADYTKTLDKALASDKAADETYKKKCEALKDLLSSIDGRAVEKIRSLKDLGL
ncbi:MAG: hypothetical protein U0939_02665 [Pirellulales bacterium]